MTEERDVYQFIAGHYNNDKSISVYGRNESGVELIQVIGFDPYFYVPKAEAKQIKHVIDLEEGFKSIYGDELTKLVVDTPNVVPALREKFTRHYEADIPFIRRFLIDAGIVSGFSVPKGKKRVHYKSIRPEDFIMHAKFCLFDIETDSLDATTGNILINCCYDSITKQYLTIYVHPEGESYVKKYSDNHKCLFVSNQEELLEASKKIFERSQPDVLSAWNVGFDKDFLEEQGKDIKLYFPFKKMNVFDYMKAYRMIKPKASDKLADVMEDENLVEKIGYEPFKYEYWKNDIDRAVRINKSHVGGLVELNKKHNTIGYFWEGKNMAGFEQLSSTLWHSLTIDIMALRRYNGKYVLPSCPSKEEVKALKIIWKKKKIGGKVFEPEPGIYDNQGNFDMSRFYSELLIAQNLSPEPHGDELGEFPLLSIELNDTRGIYDAKLKKMTAGTEEHTEMLHRRKYVKFRTESLIGWFGHEASRLFDPENIYNKVTTKGRKGIEFIGKICQDKGYSLTYGDTDGILINIPLKEAHGFVDYLNNKLIDFSKQEGMNRNLSLKLDSYAKRILFTKKRGEDAGAKKKYAARIVWEDGKECDYIQVKGFEYIRRDSSAVTKKIQHKLFDVILKEEKSIDKVRDDLRVFLRSEVKKIRNDKYSLDEIAITKTIHRDPEKYPKPQDYIRGAIYANNWLGTEIKGEFRVKMLYVKSMKGYPKTDVISVPSMDFVPDSLIVDKEKLIEKTIKNKVEEIINLVGLKWEEVGSRAKRL